MYKGRLMMLFSWTVSLMNLLLSDYPFKNKVFFFIINQL